MKALERLGAAIDAGMPLVAVVLACLTAWACMA